MTNKERVESFNDQERFTFLIMCSNDCRTLTAKWFGAEYEGEERFWEDIKTGGENHEN